MKAFFEGIADLFVNYLFWPFDQLRHMENWWGANFLNWIFMIIAAAAMVYWMIQLKKYNDLGEEDKDATAHSYI
ncbi:MAG: uracil phosphoribosyltransferase [Sediminicola sp.]|tara:strand:+ start:34431 stop:34652 length:222 start_codon:yes stop_codon:yes gene_type:complete